MGNCERARLSLSEHAEHAHSPRRPAVPHAHPEAATPRAGEGGIRVNSWVSGGFLPTKVRGTKYEGLACAWDWCECTGCSLATLPPLPAAPSWRLRPLLSLVKWLPASHASCR